MNMKDNSKRRMDRSNLLTRRNSTSEPNLATAARRPRTDLKSGFPPGITVDELWHYRRKKSDHSWPLDNIHLEEGSFKLLKSEYRRRYKNYYDFGSLGHLDLKAEDLSPIRGTKPQDCIQLSGSTEFDPEGKELVKRSLDFLSTDGNEMKENRPSGDDFLTEIRSKYIKHPPTPRPPLIKKTTNLKLEGEFHPEATEHREQFIEYPIDSTTKLAPIIQPPNLKLEGEMNTQTENREKFITYEYQKRPPLYRKLTNLHLEGDLVITSDKGERFPPYQVQQRPPLEKKSTNLHIEGDFDLVPEYRREFVEYERDKIDRPRLVHPVDHLTNSGGFVDQQEGESDSRRSYQRQIHPDIPFLRQNSFDHPLHDHRTIRNRSPSPAVLNKTAVSLTELRSENRAQFTPKTIVRTHRPQVATNLRLEGAIDLNPEYKNAYVDYNENELHPPVRGRRAVAHQANNLRSEGEMDISPEYSRSYVDFPRERPRVRRPECSISSEGEMNHMTEKREKYIAHPHAPRSGPLKRPPELKLEGHFECQPEYRKAYIDYLIRERVERKPRPLDNLGKARTFEEEKLEKATPQTIEAPPQAESSTTAKKHNGKSPRRPRSLSQLETCAFGPKLKVPEVAKRSSRSPSPRASACKTLPRGRIGRKRNDSLQTQTTDSDQNESEQREKHRKFGGSILVENLVNVSRSTTPLPLLNISGGGQNRNKWMRDSSVESSNSAFVVLDRNSNISVHDDKRGGNKLRVENRWVPSWYNSAN